MGQYHARLSPSGAARWAVCTASPRQQEGRPNESNPAARLGTCGHQMCAELLEGKAENAAAYLGRVMGFWTHAESDSGGEDWVDLFSDLQRSERTIQHEVTVSEELVAAVQSAVNFIKNIHATRGGTMLVERSVSIAQFTGEEGATGSADVIILTGDTIVTVDLKLGRHKVLASEPQSDGTRRINLQLGSYCLGALHDYGPFHDTEITTVTAMIVQPFLGHVSEYSCSVDELRKVEDFLRDAARRTREDPVFVPEYSTCHFCRAKSHCHAQRAEVFKNALDGFEEEVPKTDPTLSYQYSKVALIRDWCDAIEARAHKDLSSGIPLEGYKMVEGRKGNRSWKDEQLIEEMMARMRLKKEHIYNLKLKSPSDIEKSKELGPTQRIRLLAQCHQPDGKPTIVPITDLRPALSYTEPFES